MTDTPPPRRAGNRKTLAFVVGGLILVAAVGIAFFADRAVMGSAGGGMSPPVSTDSPAPIANPAEPGAPTSPRGAGPAN